jgi:hypothetical protein
MVQALPRWQPCVMQSIRPSFPSPAFEDRAFYVESSIPPGVTVDEYRRGRPRRLTRWGRLKRLAGAGGAGGAAAAPA